MFRYPISRSTIVEAPPLARMMSFSEDGLVCVFLHDSRSSAFILIAIPYPTEHHCISYSIYFITIATTFTSRLFLFAFFFPVCILYFFSVESLLIPFLALFDRRTLNRSKGLLSHFAPSSYFPRSSASTLFSSVSVNSRSFVLLFLTR
jgi:hypothetical protein